MWQRAWPVAEACLSQFLCPVPLNTLKLVPDRTGWLALIHQCEVVFTVSG